VLSSLMDRLLHLDAMLVYGVVGALVFVEDALFVGFVVPGETAAILGGVAASIGHVQLPVIIIVVVAAAIIGDSVGYEVGARFGPKLLSVGPLRKREKSLQNARALLARRGGTAVFLGRFIAFFRAVMPALAGIAHMPYRRFLAFNAAGGLTWGLGSVLLGYLAGDSYSAVEKVAGRATAIGVAVIALIALVVWRIRRRTTHRQQEES
jgi:membrane protein DedA with SNARE-associated domain